MSLRDRAAELAAHRAHLRLRVQQQREALSEHVRAFEPLLTWANRGAQAWAYVREHRWMATVPAIALLALGRGRGRALSGVLVAWRVLRSLRGLVAAYRRSARD